MLKYKLDQVSHNQTHGSFCKILWYVKLIKNGIDWKLTTRICKYFYHSRHEALQKPRGTCCIVLSQIITFQQFSLSWNLFIWSRQVIVWMQSILIRLCEFISTPVAKIPLFSYIKCEFLQLNCRLYWSYTYVYKYTQKNTHVPTVFHFYFSYAGSNILSLYNTYKSWK